MKKEKQSSNQSRSILILLVIGVLMFVTKPDKQDFKDYINHQVEKETATLVDEWLTKAGMGLMTSTRTDDYLVFTVNDLNMPDGSITYIGVFGYFIQIPQ